MYKVGDLVELLSFFDKVPTGVFGIVIAVFEAPAGFYGLTYPEEYETVEYYKVDWYDFPDLPSQPVYEEDIFLIQGVDDR